jgi:hypothetical protein
MVEGQDPSPAVPLRIDRRLHLEINRAVLDQS